MQRVPLLMTGSHFVLLYSFHYCCAVLSIFFLKKCTTLLTNGIAIFNNLNKSAYSNILHTDMDVWFHVVYGENRAPKGSSILQLQVTPLNIHNCGNIIKSKYQIRLF